MTGGGPNRPYDALVGNTMVEAFAKREPHVPPIEGTAMLPPPEILLDRCLLQPIREQVGPPFAPPQTPLNVHTDPPLTGGRFHLLR